VTVRLRHASAPRRAVAAALAVLSLGAPTATHAVSLAQLLQLPLAQLLQLEITVTPSAAAHFAGERDGR
jgi:hypothetical protein